MSALIGASWLGLGFGDWLAIVVAVLLVAAIARYILVERPRDRRDAIR